MYSYPHKFNIIIRFIRIHCGKYTRIYTLYIRDFYANLIWYSLSRMASTLREQGVDCYTLHRSNSSLPFRVSPSITGDAIKNFRNSGRDFVRIRAATSISFRSISAHYLRHEVNVQGLIMFRYLNGRAEVWNKISKIKPSKERTKGQAWSNFPKYNNATAQNSEKYATPTGFRNHYRRAISRSSLTKMILNLMVVKLVSAQIRIIFSW